MNNNDKQEIDLLYGETIFVFKAIDDVDSFSMTHVFPLEVKYQFPIIYVANY